MEVWKHRYTRQHTALKQGQEMTGKMVKIYEVCKSALIFMLRIQYIVLSELYDNG